MKYVIGVLALIVALVGLSTFFGSFYTVNEGDRGVILRNGAFQGVANPGLGFKLPFLDDVVDISVRDNVRTYATQNSDGTYTGGLAAYSKDQQTATVRLSLNYVIAPDFVDEVYRQYGSESNMILRLVDPKVYEETKNVFGRYNAVTIVQDRAKLNTDIEQAIIAAVEGPVSIISVQIENIDFSDEYEQSIEARMMAEVEVQKIRQNAEREKINAEIAVTQANARADSQLAEAKASAEAVRIRGEADADAIRAKGDALKQSPDLIRLTQAERWDGKLPAQMIPGSAVPFLNLTPTPQ